MKTYLTLLLAGLVTMSAAYGCKKDEPQQVEPARSGERGTSCEAKNDCGDDYSCIFGICQPADFDIETTVKECFSVDCAATADCCGDKVTEAPAKCRAQATTCSPDLPGCFEGDSCLADSDCDNGGSCTGGTRRCSDTFDICDTFNPCEQDTCIFPIGAGGTTPGTCSLSFTTCNSDAECVTENNCGGGFCECDNPDYNPLDPICSDPECDDICTMVCEDEQCRVDDSCEDDTECFGTLDMCVNGECAECATTADCDDPLSEDDDLDECINGLCIEPCTQDTECGLFEACVEGECSYRGCTSDRECILQAGTFGFGMDDPRLMKCVEENGIGTCTVECEIDAQCPATHICKSGACEYIGCNTDEECKTVLGLHDQMTIPDVKPWISTAVCREPLAAN